MYTYASQERQHRRLDRVFTDIESAVLPLIVSSLGHTSDSHSSSAISQSVSITVYDQDVASVPYRDKPGFLLKA